MKKIIFINQMAFVIFFMLSCNETRNDHFSYNISNLEPNNNVSIFDYFSKIELVPLETTDESLINHRGKTLFNNGKCYILDRKQNALFVFSEKGKFVNKINNIGKGPGEYTSISDFQINKYRHTIELLDPHGKIFEFSLDGTFIQVTKLPMRAIHYFEILNADTILFYKNFDEVRMKFYSRSKKKIIAEDCEVPAFISKTGYSSPNGSFCWYNDSLYYWEPFSNDIFHVDKSKLKIRYTWDFGKYNFDIHKIPNDKSREFYIGKEFREDINSSYANMFCYNIENENYIFTSFIYKGLWQCLILSKKDCAYKTFNKTIEGIYYATPVLFNGGMASVTNPTHLHFRVNKDLLDKKNREIFDKVRINDNPVMVKYFFK